MGEATDFDPARLEAELLPEELAAERWLPLIYFDCRYDVSDMGRVRSWCRPGSGAGTRRKIPRVLAVRISSNGYVTAKLYKGSNVCNEWWVHRLVLHAFIGEPEDGAEGHHKNGRCTNNRLSNLEWRGPEETGGHKRDS